MPRSGTSSESHVPFVARQGLYVAKRKQVSIVRMLQNRERTGSLHHKTKKIVTSRSIFERLPCRLGFNIKGMVPSATLRQGHVFLGFSKHGQFVMSYTCAVEPQATRERMFSHYKYTLHWWLFRPYQQLQLVSSVGLFDDDSVTQDLYIAICQWPADDTQLLVYGYAHWHDGLANDEEKHLVYVTVTAIPPPVPCAECVDVVHVPNVVGDETWEDGGDTKKTSLCLRHCFAVHTRFELVPPFPPFTPGISMRKDGHVVINTGDSIVILSVHYNQEVPAAQCTELEPAVCRSDDECEATGGVGTVPAGPLSPRGAVRRRLVVEEEVSGGEPGGETSGETSGEPDGEGIGHDWLALAMDGGEDAAESIEDPYDFMIESEEKKIPQFKHFHYRESELRLTNRHIIGFSYANRGLISQALSSGALSTVGAASPASQSSADSETCVDCSQHCSHHSPQSCTAFDRVYVEGGTVRPRAEGAA